MDFSLEQAITILERTPRTLRALLSGLAEPWVRNNDGADTWSPFDVVGHLVHGERTDWIPRAQIILQVGAARTFEPFDRFAQFRENEGRSLADLLDAFEALRTENIAVLRRLRLGSTDLERQGRHPDLGAVTLRELLATWVVHDLTHLAQIVEVMASQYREEVGPWRAYIPALDRKPSPG